MKEQKGYKFKKYCRCCKSKNLIKYINLGKQPLANSYHKNVEAQPRYPLEVMLCVDCYHSQLSVVVQADLLFKNYLYVSGTTQTFKDHCKALAKDAVERYKKKKLNVLDIACNDGSQLEYFRDLGCDVYGVDPAENLRSITKKKKIPVEIAYWKPNIAEKIGKKFDIITATNVFAHVDDLDEFLTACKVALHDEGTIILEFPYANKMVELNEFDTVYHEHLSYFLAHSLKVLVQRMGFSIVDIIQTPIHGGSIRFFLQINKKSTPKLYSLLRQEEKKGLYKKNTYSNFEKKVKKNKETMKALIHKMKQQNYKVVGYGASAKGNTMLNYFKVKFDYIVDDNELKWSYYTPGQDILIKPPVSLKEEKNKLAIAILSWNFANEIIQKVNYMRNNKNDKFIVYVPKVKSFKTTDKNQYTFSA